GRELLDAGVVLLHGVVEETAGGGELVLDVGELGLELLEGLIGLQVRVGLGPREQLAERAGERVFAGRPPGRGPRRPGGGAGLCAAMAALRSLTTSSRVPRSWAA